MYWTDLKTMLEKGFYVPLVKKARVKLDAARIRVKMFGTTMQCFEDLSSVCQTPPVDGQIRP